MPQRPAWPGHTMLGAAPAHCTKSFDTSGLSILVLAEHTLARPAPPAFEAEISASLLRCFSLREEGLLCVWLTDHRAQQPRYTQRQNISQTHSQWCLLPSTGYCSHTPAQVPSWGCCQNHYLSGRGPSGTQSCKVPILRFVIGLNHP